MLNRSYINFWVDFFFHIVKKTQNKFREKKEKMYSKLLARTSTSAARPQIKNALSATNVSCMSSSAVLNQTNIEIGTVNWNYFSNEIMLNHTAL